MTDKEYKNYAEYIFDNAEYTGSLSFNTDDVECDDVEFIITKGSRFFKITHLETYQILFCKTFKTDYEEEITVETITIFIKQIYEILDTLVFDKTKTLFYEKTK